MMLIKPNGGDLYFYRVVSIDTTGNPETLACATRRGGIAVVALPRADAEQVVFSSTFPGLDIVDVCSIGSGAPAVCAAGKDCTLVFFRDVLRERKPITVKFDRVQGTAYRLMSARGHLFLLTSSSMYMFPGLTNRFLEGQPIGRLPAQVRSLPIEAVDANMSHDRWLLIVTTKGVIRFDVNLLVDQAPISGPHEDSEEASPKAMAPDWMTQGREATIAVVY
ncbi:MAG: hypothetical protein ACJ8FY_10490 [Gemmataceae bacterium]